MPGSTVHCRELKQCCNNSSSNQWRSTQRAVLQPSPYLLLQIWVELPHNTDLNIHVQTPSVLQQRTLTTPTHPNLSPPTSLTGLPGALTHDLVWMTQSNCLLLEATGPLHLWAIEKHSTDVLYGIGLIILRQCVSQWVGVVNLFLKINDIVFFT